MAVTKTGIDYYPRDVGLMRDRKFNRARQKYGYLIYVIYDALLEMIYSDKGYYLLYDNVTKDDVLWDLQDYCKGKYSVESATISDVIGMLVECGLFSGYHFKQGIITSRRIQEVYYRTTVERRKVDVDFNIWMLSLEEMKTISSKSLILQSAEVRANIERSSDEHQPNNKENQTKNEDNQTNFPQSKVNKSKVNKTIYYIYNSDIENVTRDDCLNKFKELTGEQEIGNKNRLLLETFTDNLDDKLFYYILLEAENNRDKWKGGTLTNYISKKSMDIMKSGIQTYEEFMERGVKNE